MATIEQLESALRKADAAGAADDARALAAEIRKVRAVPKANFSDVSAKVGGGREIAPPKGNAVGRALGEVGGRQVLQGAYGLYGALGGDALNYYVLDPLDKALFSPEPTMSGLITGQKQAPSVLGTGGRSYRDMASDFADSQGMRKPQTPGERVVSDIGEGLTGTALTMGLGGLLAKGGQLLETAAPTISQRLGGFLSAQPKLQAVSTATGAGAASVTRESGGGQGAQLTAGLIGGLSPGLAQMTAAATTRGLIRGTSGQRVEDTVNTFRAAGTTPSAGQAAGTRRSQALETLLATVPGGAGPMAGKATSQASQVSSRLDDLAGELTQRGASVTPTQAGNAIHKGVTGPDGFLAETRKVSNQLYDNLDSAIAPDTRVDVGNVTTALRDLNASIPGAPSVSKFFQNGRIQGIEGALSSDTTGIAGVLSRPGMQARADSLRGQLTQQSEAAEQAYARQVQAVEAENARRASLGMNNMQPAPLRPSIPGKKEIDGQVDKWLTDQVDGKLPYEALKKLRTLVGNELENYSIASDVPRSKWKAVYGALTKDLETVAGQSPEAKRAWDRANTYYNARVKRIEAIDHVIDKSGGGEKIYAAAFSGTKDGATTLRAVMQSLPEDAQKEVAAAFVRRMGKAVGSQQDDAGDVFSMSTYLTNWNNTSKEARRVLFDRFGPNFSRNMDRVASMASNVRDGSKVFANPSGTGRVNALVATSTGAASTIGTLLATGNAGGAAAAATGVAATYAGTNWLARKMVDPKFVNWLAMSTGLPLSAIPAQASMLRQIGKKEKDPDYEEAAKWLEENANNGGGK